MTQRLDNRKFFTCQEADQCAAAGADVGNLVGLAVFCGCSDAVAAADDCECLCVTECILDHLCAELCQFCLKDTPRAVDKDCL